MSSDSKKSTGVLFVIRHPGTPPIQEDITMRTVRDTILRLRTRNTDMDRGLTTTFPPFPLDQVASSASSFHKDSILQGLVIQIYSPNSNTGAGSNPKDLLRKSYQIWARFTWLSLINMFYSRITVWLTQIGCDFLKRSLDHSLSEDERNEILQDPILCYLKLQLTNLVHEPAAFVTTGAPLWTRVCIRCWPYFVVWFHSHGLSVSQLLYFQNLKQTLCQSKTFENVLELRSLLSQGPEYQPLAFRVLHDVRWTRVNFPLANRVVVIRNKLLNHDQ